MNWEAVAVTVKLATLSAIILLVLGIPIAYWLAFSRARFKVLVEAVVAMPLVLPPTVLGFYLLTAMGPRSPLGRSYQAVTGSTLPFTFEGLVVGSVLYSLPFAVQPLAASFAAVPPRLIEASWTLGVSRVGTLFRLILPHSRAGLVTGFVLSFAHTLGEFGVVLMVGGNIEGLTRTLSIDIYDDVQALDYQGAAATSMALLVFSFLVLVLVYSIQGRVRLLEEGVARRA
jgi:molybdate transport system permease protein